MHLSSHVPSLYAIKHKHWCAFWSSIVMYWDDTIGLANVIPIGCTCTQYSVSVQEPNRKRNVKRYGLNVLKPMDSFGMWWKSIFKWNNFSSLIHNFIVLWKLLMSCQLFAQKCSNCQEIIKISKCLGSSRVPNTLPLVIYIGIFCYWALLHYNMSFKTFAGGFNGAFWWYGPLSEDQEIF